MKTLRGDLHLHTTASDGVLETDAVVEAARLRSLAVIAITDHETVAGWPAPSQRLPRIVHGAEVASVLDDQEFHLLCYFPEDAGVAGKLFDEIRVGRLERFEAMKERLRELGYDIDSHVEIPETNVSPGRPHVARALVSMGAATSVKDAFDRFLEEGGPAYVPRPKVTPLDVIEAVHASRGLVSLGHPAHVKGGVPFRRFKEWGLDAVEAYHPSADPQTTRVILDIADKYRLVVTGGSDFHDPERDQVGTPFLPEGRLLTFLSALERGRMT